MIKLWFDVKTNDLSLFEPIKIYNLRDKKNLIEPWEVRVDRENILGNPYILKSERYRDIVCDNYNYWLLKEIENNNVNIVDELNRLLNIYIEHNRLHLYCWCAPKRCHAESIRNKIYEMKNDVRAAEWVDAE